jgi:hypothetical protein
MTTELLYRRLVMLFSAANGMTRVPPIGRAARSRRLSITDIAAGARANSTPRVTVIASVSTAMTRVVSWAEAMVAAAAKAAMTAMIG